MSQQDGVIDMGTPPDVKWQIGKTAASIVFVQDAEEYIADHPDTLESRYLKRAITRIKIDQLVILNPTNIEEWLSSRLNAVAYVQKPLPPSDFMERRFKSNEDPREILEPGVRKITWAILIILALVSLFFFVLFPFFSGKPQ